MTIYDISLTITPELPTWPGDPSIHVELVEQIAKGDVANVSRMDMGVHTGTHVDAPFHFIQDGGTVEKLPLDVLTGSVDVIQIPEDAGVIDAAVLSSTAIPNGVERVLFKTRNSKLWAKGDKSFHKDFVALAPDGARLLVERGIKLVGIDYLSIAPFTEPVPTHQILLKASVVILEGADLSRVPAGRYTLYCLPLKLGGAEGAPARVILLSE